MTPKTYVSTTNPKILKAFGDIKAAFEEEKRELEELLVRFDAVRSANQAQRDEIITLRNRLAGKEQALIDMATKYAEDTAALKREEKEDPDEQKETD